MNQNPEKGVVVSAMVEDEKKGATHITKQLKTVIEKREISLEKRPRYLCKVLKCRTNRC